MRQVVFRTGARVTPVERVQAYARVVVRAGLLADGAALADVRAAARDELACDADNVARDAVEAARRDLELEQQSWPPLTDLDRLEVAFDELAARGVVVLAGVDDHWRAAGELTRRDELGERVAGVAWFTAADVWHAVEHGMLEINLWHGDSANVAPGDELLTDVLAVLAGHDVDAHFDEGRIEAAVRWQRRR